MCGYTDNRDINFAGNMLRIAMGRVEDEWLNSAEKKLSLIERLFRNIKKYINLSGMDSNLRPTAGPAGSYAPRKGNSSLW